MAEGGDFGTSADRASDVLFDFSCSICEEKGKNTEALVYCEQCVKPLCTTCNDLHRPLFSNHVILGKDNIDQWGGEDRNVAMDTCEVHRDREADMFCHDHDTLCCYVCISTKHRLEKTT